jgi:hypothetical protein
MKPDTRIMELCDRLTSPGAAQTKLSASELHELVDFIRDCDKEHPNGELTGPGHTPNAALMVPTMKTRRGFLQSLAKALVIGATAPIIVREALRIEEQVIGNLDDGALWELNWSTIMTPVDHGPHFYDWVMADDKQAYLDKCAQSREEYVRNYEGRWLNQKA